MCMSVSLVSAAIVIGPNVMRAPPEFGQERLITDAGLINALVRNFVEHYDTLFPSSSAVSPATSPATTSTDNNNMTAAAETASN